MAPVATPLLGLLLAAGAVMDVTAKPLMPGRHGSPKLMSALSGIHKKGLKGEASNYYEGKRGGLSKPPALPEKRAQTIPAGWTSTGCVDESWGQRLLQGMGFSSGKMTPLLCLTTCASSGFAYAGTEYTDECYCGNSLIGSGGVVSPASSCAMACAGDSSQTCGGNWMMNLYHYNASDASNACSPAATPLTTTAITTTATTTPTTTATTQTTTTNTAAHPVHTDATDASEWYSLGCAQDGGGANRILTGYQQQYIGTLTVDWCLSTCESKGFSFAGVEYGQECYCGNTVPTTITYSDNQCTYPCTGDKTETCGGYYYQDLYELISSSNCPVTATNNNLVAIPTAINVATTTAATAAGTAVTAAPTNNVPASSNDHQVWAHHMVGNTYPYTQSNWASDISSAIAAGIDGFALNMGSDSWQPDRINDAYTAAQNSGTGFKLFLSLDMTVMGCWSSNDANNLVSLVQRWAHHPNQATHNGKVLVSTFAGSDCNFGIGTNNGWQTMFVNPLTSSGVNIFFVPSLFSDMSTFSSNSWMDGELNWNSGWPTGAGDLTTSSDVAYMNALGGKEYMPAISPFFYTHFGQNSWNKNWLYKGDDWLYCTRWEQVIAMRGQVKMTELLTWNDYGESSYIGPIEGALPAGSDVWVNGYDHQGLNALTKYYATAFKTGQYPAITQDKIIMWSRPHPHDATASNDGVGRPTGWDWTTDYVWAVVLATNPASVTLTSGSTSQTFSVSAGLTKLKIPSAPGGMGGSISRNGQTVASYTSNGFTYTTTPQTYNYNYFVGSSS